MQLKTTPYNFKGAFLVKSPSQKVKDEMPEIIGKKKQIFYNFNENNDVFYVMRDSSDKRVKQYLDSTSTEYKYYPYLNTKCGFDDEKPEEAKAIIAKAEKEALIKAAQKTAKQNKEPQYVENILKALSLTGNKVTYVNKKLYRIVEDASGKRLATISPQGKYGLSFVMVESKHSEENSRFLAMDEAGKIIHEYTTLDGIHQFNLNFNNAVKYQRELLNKNNKS